MTLKRLSVVLLSLALCPARAAAQATSIVLSGETTGDLFGWSVALAGNVDGDGVADVVVGAPGNDAGAGFAGRAYLFRGPFTGPRNAAQADATVRA